MAFLATILISILVLNLGFGWWAYHKLRGRRRLRQLIVLFVALQVALYAWFIAARVIHFQFPVPGILAAGMYIWNLIVLPAAMILIFVGELVLGAVLLVSRLMRRRRQKESEPKPVAEAQGNALSRRSFLAASAAVLPPLAGVAGAGIGIAQFRDIRVRRFVIESPMLPPNLDGITIAHLSDLHIGRFVDGKIIRLVTEMTNQLRPDVICFTGDLIDFSIADLPAGLDMFKRLDPKLGIAVCEGNHDLFESASGFVKRTKAAGVNLLSDESMIISHRGEEIQLLGMRWGMHDRPREFSLDEHATATLTQMKKGAFPILLAHHPHAFDPAWVCDVPLTLSGHTHGGQLMLTQNFGPGPLMYKYWSGLYQHKKCSLIVSNGVGNWFPLRINAPAEIVHITLKSV